MALPAARPYHSGMTRWARFGLLVSAALGILSACASKRDRPANADLSCDGGDCVPTKGGGGGGGASSDAAVDAAGEVTVTGTVKIVTQDDFVAVDPFTGSANVEMEDPNGLAVEGKYDGTKFSVDGVSAKSPVWATVTPSTKITALSTVQLALTNTGKDIELVVVAPVVIETIYSLLTTPVEREVGAAHVVVRFVDPKTGVPIKGVTVSHDKEAVAYDEGGSWSDVAPGTGDLGLAVVVNLAPGTKPSKQKLLYKSGTLSGGVEVLVAPDAVTLAEVGVTP